MASQDIEANSVAVPEFKNDKLGNGNLGSDLTKTTTMKAKKSESTMSNYVLRFICFRIEKDPKGNLDMEVVGAGGSRDPTHLVIMVNGLIGSAQDWKYAAKQFLKNYSEDIIVHCSERNSSTLTLDGIDVMGERLADEVKSVIKRHPNLQKISFICHSLGGLITRYAVARLYEESKGTEASPENGNCKDHESNDSCLGDRSRGKIAGLEPINFITSATPHLGTRGHKQVPVFCGLYSLEKAAVRTSWFLGRTGNHLFLTDGDNGKPPLLLQMVNNCEDLKYLSALQCFKRRVAYANMRFDQLVGWSTSSLRRRSELPKLRRLSRNERYPHIVNVEAATIAAPKEEVSLDAKDSASDAVDMEEVMIKKLTEMSWERVDVSFSGSKQRFLAHNTIQVKNYLINSDGADVVQHMIDHFLL